MKEERLMEDAIYQCLKMVAPGTLLSDGLENILRARTGGLVVVGNSEKMMELVNGGFKIDAPLHPASLYELAKMDGAIVLSSDAQRILYANTQLTPDPMIPSFETGTRHRTAERVARQTGELVLSISQRRDVVTLYKGQAKFVLRDVSVVLAKANQALSTLEKYKSVFKQSLTNLSALEFEDLATLVDVCTAIQRGLMVSLIASEIDKYIVQLGIEGRLAKMQLEELMADIEDEARLVVKDYFESTTESLEQVWQELTDSSSDDLLQINLISKVLGYGSNASLDQPVTPRGFRILRKIPRLPAPVITNLVDNFGDLPTVLECSIEELDEVEGIGEVRAKAIKEGLRRLREHVLLDRHL